MTKKKRELIEILLDNITPDDWPEGLPYAAQVDTGEVYAFSELPRYWKYCLDEDSSGFINIFTVSEISRGQHKTIVTRDEFMKRWNERIHSATNATTPPAQQEANAEETKPIQQENINAYEWPNKLKLSCSPMDRLLNELEKQSATDTQVGGNHYTKLAIQPMQYSMENGLDALQHTVIKYVTRFRDKNGIEDLEKAKHCIDMLIEFERGKK